MTIRHPYRVVAIVEDAFLGIAKYQTLEWESKEYSLPSPNAVGVGKLDENNGLSFRR